MTHRLFNQLDDARAFARDAAKRGNKNVIRKQQHEWLVEFQDCSSTLTESIQKPTNETAGCEIDNVFHDPEILHGSRQKDRPEELVPKLEDEINELGRQLRIANIENKKLSSKLEQPVRDLEIANENISRLQANVAELQRTNDELKSIVAGLNGDTRKERKRAEMRYSEIASELQTLKLAIRDKFGKFRIEQVPVTFSHSTRCHTCGGDGGLNASCSKCGGTGLFSTSEPTSFKDVLIFDQK